MHASPISETSNFPSFRVFILPFPLSLHVGELAYGDRPHEVTGGNEGEI
jgi:hypothetical protein